MDSPSHVIRVSWVRSLARSGAGEGASRFPHVSLSRLLCRLSLRPFRQGHERRAVLVTAPAAVRGRLRSLRKRCGHNIPDPKLHHTR